MTTPDVGESSITIICANCGSPNTVPLGAASAEPDDDGPGIQPGMESGPGMPQPGTMGAEMSARWPAERASHRNARLHRNEENR